MQFIAEAYDVLSAAGLLGRPSSPRCSASGTRATSTPSSSRSPPRCSTRSTPRPAAPPSTHPRPGRAEGHRPLDGPDRARARRPRRRRSPRRSSPGPPPATPPSARRARPVLAGPTAAVTVDDRQRLRRRRPRRALGVEGRRLRAGPRDDPQGQREYDWGVDIATVARIWRGGCIIRARLLAADQRRVRGVASSRPCSSPRASPRGWPSGRMRGAGWSRRRRRPGCRCPGSRRRSRTTTRSGPSGCRPPCVQGLRDNFGAHTYQRTDRDGTFHTLWSGDRTEIDADAHPKPRRGGRMTLDQTLRPADPAARRRPPASGSPSPAGSTRRSCSPSRPASSDPRTSSAVLGVSPSLAGTERGGGPRGRRRPRGPGRRGRHPRGRRARIPGERPGPVLPLQGRAVHPDRRRGRRPARGWTRSPTARTPTTRDDRTARAPGRRPSTRCCARWPTPGLTKADVRDARPGARSAQRRQAGRAVPGLAHPALLGGDPEKLAQVEAAEAAVRALGFADCRVRHHGEVARVELLEADLDRACVRAAPRGWSTGVRAAGFRFVTRRPGGDPVRGVHPAAGGRHRMADAWTGDLAELDLGRASAPRVPRGGVLRRASRPSSCARSPPRSGPAGGPALFTRCPPEHVAVLREVLPDARSTSAPGWWPGPPRPGAGRSGASSSLRRDVRPAGRPRGAAHRAAPGPATPSSSSTSASPGCTGSWAGWSSCARPGSSSWSPGWTALCRASSPGWCRRRWSRCRRRWATARRSRGWRRCWPCSTPARRGSRWSTSTTGTAPDIWPPRSRRRTER